MITAAGARQLTKGLSDYMDKADKAITHRAADGYSTAEVEVPKTFQKTLIEKLSELGFTVSKSEKHANKLIINW